MALTVIFDGTTIDQAEATTNWANSGFSNLATVDDLRIQGSFCLQARASNTTGWCGCDADPSSANAINLTDGRHIFAWLESTTPASDDTKVNGGLAIWAGTDSTITITGTSPSNGPNNSKQWFVDGKDTNAYAGWKCYVVDPQSTPTVSLGSPNMASVQRIGVRKKTTSTVATSTRDTLFDVLRLGYGLQINGDGATQYGLNDIYAVDSAQANAYGALLKINGVFYASGRLTIGSTGQTAQTNLKDTGQVLVFNDYPVAATLQGLVLRGAASFPSTVQVGNYSGGVTSGGWTVRGAGNGVWNIDCGANTSFKAYASTLERLRQASLSATSEIRDCVIPGATDAMTPNGAPVVGCTFTAGTGTHALIINSASDMSPVTGDTFTGLNRAIKITAAGTYTFNGIEFSGNTYDVDNASGGAVIINVTGGGSTPTYINSAGGSTTVNSAVSVTIDAPVSLSGAEIRIYDLDNVPAGSLGTELSGTESHGSATYTYSGQSGNTIWIQIMKTGYKEYGQSYTIPASDATLTARLEAESNA
jgi:hypothetical protein